MEPGATANFEASLTETPKMCPDGKIAFRSNSSTSSAEVAITCKLQSPRHSLPVNNSVIVGGGNWLKKRTETSKEEKGLSVRKEKLLKDKQETAQTTVV